MKKSLVYLFAMLFMAGSFVACSSSSDDKDENKPGTGGGDLGEVSLIEGDWVLNYDMEEGVDGNTLKSSPIILESLPLNKDLDGLLRMGADMGGIKLIPMIESISFGKNGEITAKYFSIDAEGTPVGNALTSPEGLVQYSLDESEAVLTLKPNVEAILAKLKEDGIENDAITQVLQEKLPKEIKVKSIFSDKNELLSVKLDITALAKDNLDEIITLIDSTEFGPAFAMFKPVLVNGVKDATSIEAGLKLKRK